MGLGVDQIITEEKNKQTWTFYCWMTCLYHGSLQVSLNELANLSMPALHRLQHLAEDLIAGHLGTVSITLQPGGSRKQKLPLNLHWSFLGTQSTHLLFIVKLQPKTSF